MTKNDGERLVALEVKVTDLATTLNEVKADVKEIKQSLTPIMDFDKRLKRLESSSNFWKWLSPTLSAVLSAFLTFLILSFLNHVK